MQSVKELVREVLINRVEGDGSVTVEELDELIQYKYTSQGYSLFHTQKEPIYADNKYNGFRVYYTFVKEEEQAKKAK